MLDYHTHTYLCKHATGKPEEYLAAAEKAGLSELGVSDHSPWPSGYDPEWRMSPEEYPIYHEIIDNLRKINSPVKVKYGVETDWVPGKMDETYANLAKYDFDYVIGSIHYVEDFPFDNPEVLPVWEIEGKAEWVWNNYYRLMLDYVSEGKFNIIGHFDLPKKFGSRPPASENIAKLIDEILTAASDNKIAIEINTSGIRRKANEFYPNINILKKAASKGVMLTFGSDSHHPGEIAANFADAVRMAKEVGFTHYHSFTKRIPTPIAL
jgi:histidinol-phosphatase (PHP family)